jgi:LuxR family maltose regulon positive regulatory protein
MRSKSDFSKAAISTRALLESKLTAPSPRSAIARLSLQRVLGAESDARLVLFSAPAGFGKTTLMAQYAGQLRDQGVNTGWLTLDPADNDLERLLVYLNAAFAQIDSELSDGPGLLGRTGEGTPDLAFRIPRNGRPFALFLDEFEVVQNPAVHDYIRLLISYLPPGARIVIGSRNHPNVGIGRLRARGQLLLIGPLDLRFSVEECMELLRAARGLNLSEDEVRVLHQRTEGWVAAIQLASVSLAMRDDTANFISQFSTGVSDVYEYLSEDVLRLQPAQVQSFLLRTSILGELSPGLCATVTGRADSAALLQQMERDGLFLTRVAEQLQVYRYHSIFAEFLRSQLALRDALAADEIHRVASDWFRDQGRLVPAIEHALASGDFGRVMSMLGTEAELLFKEGRFELLQRWFDRIPIEVLRPYADLMVMFALALPRKDKYLRIKQLIDHMVYESDSTPDWARAHEAHSLTMQDKLAQCLALCDDDSARGQLPPGRRLRMSSLFLANALVAADEFPRALRYLEEGKRSFAALDSVVFLALAEKVHGMMELGQGRLRDALLRLRRAYDTIPPDEDGALACAVGTGLAVLLYEAGDMEAAQRLLARCHASAMDSGFPDILIAGSVTHARILMARGLQAEAFAVIADMESKGYDAQLPRVVASAWLERARIAILAGDHALAKGYLANADDRELWHALSGFSPYANDVDCLAIGRARLMVHTNRSDAAIPLLKSHLKDALLRQRNFRALKLRILLACALNASGDRRSAMRTLREALGFASTEGYVSAFRDEGPLVATLLRDLQESGTNSEGLPVEFLELVTGVPSVRPRASNRPQVEAPVAALPAPIKEGLTSSEARVLHLLSKGLSNQELAAQLFVSESTVKTHLARINAKLGTKRRTQAVAAARMLQIID